MSTDKNAKMSGKNFKQRYLNYVNWQKMLKNNQFLLCNLKKYKKSYKCQYNAMRHIVKYEYSVHGV